MSNKNNKAQISGVTARLLIESPQKLQAQTGVGWTAGGGGGEDAVTVVIFRCI